MYKLLDPLTEDYQLENAVKLLKGHYSNYCTKANHFIPPPGLRYIYTAIKLSEQKLQAYCKFCHKSTTYRNIVRSSKVSNDASRCAYTHMPYKWDEPAADKEKKILLDYQYNTSWWV